jgi:hypothetical protein
MNYVASVPLPDARTSYRIHHMTLSGLGLALSCIGVFSVFYLVDH